MLAHHPTHKALTCFTTLDNKQTVSKSAFLQLLSWQSGVGVLLTGDEGAVEAAHAGGLVHKDCLLLVGVAMPGGMQGLASVRIVLNPPYACLH